MASRQKELISDTNWATLPVVGNAAEAFGFRSMCGSDLGGEIPMRNAIAAHLPDEHFIIRVDGRVKSHHRRSFAINFRSTTSRCAPKQAVNTTLQWLDELKVRQ